MDERVTLCRGGFACSFLCVLVFLLSSLKGLPATRYGLTKNWFTGKVDLEHIREGGRHVLWPWVYFIEFPATLTSIEWLEGPHSSGGKDLGPMSMRTRDGLMVKLNIAVQYKLVKEKLPSTYIQFREGYENYFVSNMHMGFQDIISRHPGSDLWASRLQVQQEFHDECSALFSQRMQGLATCWGVQLVLISINHDIEKKVTDRQVQVQLQEFFGTERKATMIRAETMVLESTYNQNITVINAKAQAQAYVISHSAVAAASKNLLVVMAEGLGIIRNTVQTATAPLSTAQIIEYAEKVAVVQKTSAQLVYSAEPSSVVIGGTAAVGGAAAGDAAEAALPRRLASPASADLLAPLSPLRMHSEL